MSAFSAPVQVANYRRQRRSKATAGLLLNALKQSSRTFAFALQRLKKDPLVEICTFKGCPLVPQHMLDNGWVPLMGRDVRK